MERSVTATAGFVVTLLEMARKLRTDRRTTAERHLRMLLVTETMLHAGNRMATAKHQSRVPSTNTVRHA